MRETARPVSDPDGFRAWWWCDREGCRRRRGCGFVVVDVDVDVDVTVFYIFLCLL